MRCLTLLTLVTTCFASEWVTIVHNRTARADGKQAYLAKLTTSDTSLTMQKISNAGTEATTIRGIAYSPSTGHMYFGTVDQGASNVTRIKAVKRFTLGSADAAETIYSRELASFSFDGDIHRMIIDEKRQQLYLAVLTELPTVSLGRIDLGTRTFSIVIQSKLYEEWVTSLAIDTEKDRLYYATMRNVFSIDLAAASLTNTKISDYSPYMFEYDQDNDKIVFPRVNTIVSRPMAQVGSLFNVSSLQDQLILNLTTLKPTFQGYAQFKLDLPDKLLFSSSAEIFHARYPDGGGTGVGWLVFNATEQTTGIQYFGDMVKVTESSAIIQVAGVVVTVAVAAAISTGIASGAVGSSSSGSANASGGGVSGLLWIIINQLQFLVLLSQLGGKMPQIYTTFIESISWISLGIKGLTFGIQAEIKETANNSIANYAAMLEMNEAEAFLSLVILASIIFSALLIISTVLRLIRKNSDLSNKTLKLLGHAFILSYLSMCTLSVYQLVAVDWIVARQLGSIILGTVCSAFLVYTALVAFVGEYSPNFVRASFRKIFQDGVCGSFIDGAYISGFVTILVKYTTGIFTGALQSFENEQSIVIFVIMVLDLFYFSALRPYKNMTTGLLDLVSKAIQVASLGVKLSLMFGSVSDSNVIGIALLVMNGALVAVAVLSLFLNSLKPLLRRVVTKKVSPESAVSAKQLLKTAQLDP